MRYEFDPTKNKANIAKHGVDMAMAEEFDFDTAVESADTTQDYGEARFSAIGYISGRLYILIYTPRKGSIRIISLRKAKKKEQQKYYDQA